MLCFALRVGEKPSWAGVAFGGMARWATSASVALAEHGFPLTKHSFILKTAPRLLPRGWRLALVMVGLASGGAACAFAQAASSELRAESLERGVKSSGPKAHTERDSAEMAMRTHGPEAKAERVTNGGHPLGAGGSNSELMALGSPPAAAWGIDACLSVHVDPVSLPEWIALLRQSNVQWLRERNVWGHADFDAGIRGRMEALRAEGFEIVAFAGTPASVSAQREGNQSAEDLLAVYASGFRQGREYAGLVSAWEMTGEPDVGYFRDLPDRLAAYNKAMYLGLKSGAASAFQSGAGSLELGANSPELTAHRSQLTASRPPIVLMGALALPPGPWWERAVANGLLDYTDAYNFHFYGNAEDLTSVIRAHREAMLGARREARGEGRDRKPDQRSGLHWGRPADRSGYQGAGTRLWPLASRLEQREALPLWLTECGVNATVPGDFLNAERREFQAEFTRSTARQALAARDVAMFMPFILVNRDDPHAMTLPSPPAPLPAWDAYAKLTKETRWPERSLSSKFKVKEVVGVNPVVVQWMPAEGTASHKVAGTYRVGANEVMTGEFRVYNFGNKAAEGVLGRGGKEARGEGREAGLWFWASGGKKERVALSIPAGGCVAVPAIYTPGSDTGYFREWIKAGFEEARGERLEAKAIESRAAFGVERQPEESDFTSEPVAVYPLRGDSRVRPPEVNVEGVPFGPWRVFNGLVGGGGKLEAGNRGGKPETRNLKPEAEGVKPETGNLKPEGSELVHSGLRSQPSGFAPHSGFRSQVSALGSQASVFRFSVAKPVNDPLAPTYAMAGLRGVPENARFLRVKLDRPMTRNAAVRVDLVDADGERFSIWENLGNPYSGSSREVWLALEDFHPYFWSKAVAGNRRLRPEKVREVGLRFYLIEGGSMEVELEWMHAR